MVRAIEALAAPTLAPAGEVVLGRPSRSRASGFAASMIDDALRPPPLTDPDVQAYKDWLHLNVFDHASGAVMLFNGSLHGAPADRRARTIGTALVHLPDGRWMATSSFAAFKRPSSE